MSYAANIRRRNTGLLFAGGFALVLGGSILFMSSGARPRATQASTQPVVDIGAAPDAASKGADPNQIQQTGAARLQFVDKTDPNRVASELAYEKLDPVGPGYYSLTQPRAWMYMRDGRVMHIRADSGRVKMPSRTQQPEEGTFTGKVIVKIFPPPPRGTTAKPIDPDKDTPAILGVTESVSFDSVLLELSTQDTVHVSSKTVKFEGEGLLVRASQVKERIELLRTKGRYVRYNPILKDDKPGDKPVASAQPTPAPAPASPAAPAQKPDRPIAAAPGQNKKEQLYKATFSDSVTVSQAATKRSADGTPVTSTRKLTADTLEIFCRLIDNQLPPDAFGKWAPAPPTEGTAAKSGEAPPAESKPVLAAAKAVGAPASTASAPGDKHVPTLFVSAGDEDIVMNWLGPVVVLPLAEGAAPPELAGGNHFTARFSADKPGGETMITLSDSADESTGKCAQIQYAATSKDLQLLSGPDCPKVEFQAPDAGLFSVLSAKVNLGTGIASIPGAGRMTSVRNGKTMLVGSDNPSPAAAPNAAAANTPAAVAADTPAKPAGPLPPDAVREISWTDQADFQFRVLNGRLQNALEWAQFGGTVLARDRSSSISGDFVRADFAPVGKQPTAIKHLKVEGNAAAVGAVGGSKAFDPNRPLPAPDPYVIADRLEIAFQRSTIDPNDVDPYYAEGVGNVRAADRSSSIRADRIEARMARDAAGALVSTDVAGKGSVVFERADGVTARADDVRAHPVLRTATLTGRTVTIGRGASTITGTQMELDEAASIMRVYGAGAFDHTQTEKPQIVEGGEGATLPDSTHINAIWTKSMVFDNMRGTVDCDGNTKVTAASALESQTLQSERLRLQLTPASESIVKPAAPNAGSDLTLGDDRRLMKAEAIGASEETQGAPHATIETRRYAPPRTAEDERVLEQVFYVEGPRIIADDLRGTVTVPAAGRAIVRDQRSANTQAVLANSSGLPMGAGGPRGTSRFTWGESMEFTRSTGVLTMKKDVELVHLPIGTQQATRLVAMQLDAKFNVNEPGKSRSAELVRADATGAVYAESGQQRLLCDTFGYDALRGTAEAGAATGNRVTLYDDRKGSQLVARKLFWDLIKDRVEIMEPAPITTPR